MKPTTKIVTILVFFLLAAFVTAVLRKGSDIPIVYSPTGMVDSIWQRYKVNYLENGTWRTIDRQRSDITTSEGQSYTMLRAVWMDDRETFDRSWKWTVDNLSRNDSYLFSWLFGRRSNGQYGILTELKGDNTASDADTDIALALAFAYARWRNPQYLADSKNIINDIWNKEVVIINGRPYMASDNVQKQFNSDIVVNPSYLAPYAYRIFKDIDPAHDWMGVVDTSYEIINGSMSSTLDTNGTANIPPNWIKLRRSDAAVLPANEPNLDSNFGYDALRLPWRLALDWQWFGEERALSTLNRMSFLRNEWSSKQVVFDIYSHNGEVLDNNEVPAMYGGIIGMFMATDPILAAQIYKKELVSLYNPDSNSWKEMQGYYDDNWAWFGIALYNNMLDNLWREVNKS